MEQAVLVVSNASPPSITIYNNAATVDGDIAPVAEIAGANYRPFRARPDIC